MVERRSTANKPLYNIIELNSILNKCRWNLLGPTFLYSALLHVTIFPFLTGIVKLLPFVHHMCACAKS